VPPGGLKESNLTLWLDIDVEWDWPGQKIGVSSTRSSSRLEFSSALQQGYTPQIVAKAHPADCGWAASLVQENVQQRDSGNFFVSKVH